MTPSILNVNSVATMSSLEMAELAEKRHDSVKRTINILASRKAISQPQTVDGQKSANGVVEQVYLVGKRDSYVVMAQLSPEFTARLVDRWQELEAEKAAPAAPATLSRMEILTLALDSEKRAVEAETQLAIAAPKAQALDRIADAEGSMCITDAAKHLQMQPKRLFSWLAANDWIYRRPGNANWIAYQPRLKSGVLDHKVTTVERGDGSEKVVAQVLVTAKGLAKLAGVAA